MSAVKPIESLPEDDFTTFGNKLDELQAHIRGLVGCLDALQQLAPTTAPSFWALRLQAEALRSTAQTLGLYPRIGDPANDTQQGGEHAQNSQGT